MNKTESRLFRSFFMIITFVAMMTLAGFLTVASAASKAISDVTYPFTNAAGVSLEDLSTGSTQLIGPNLTDYRSALTDIGFDFWLDGAHYSQFSVSSHGLMRLGSVLVVTNYQNLLASTESLPKVVPYWDDLRIGTNGQARQNDAARRRMMRGGGRNRNRKSIAYLSAMAASTLRDMSFAGSARTSSKRSPPISTRTYGVLMLLSMRAAASAPSRA